jgi:hypothetical protein
LTVTVNPLEPRGDMPVHMLVQVDPPLINLTSLPTSTSRVKGSGWGMLRVRVMRYVVVAPVTETYGVMVTGMTPGLVTGMVMLLRDWNKNVPFWLTLN